MRRFYFLDCSTSLGRSCCRRSRRVGHQERHCPRFVRQKLSAGLFVSRSKSRARAAGGASKIAGLVGQQGFGTYEVALLANDRLIDEDPPEQLLEYLP